MGQKGVVLREGATMGAPYDNERKAWRSQKEDRRDQSIQGGRVSGGLRSTMGKLWRRRRMAMHWKGELEREEETMGAREEHETKGDRGSTKRDAPTRDSQS